MWKDYYDNRVIFEHQDGFVIVKPNNEEISVPFLCPRCSKKMNKINDTVSFRINFCCSECESCLSKTQISNWVDSYLKKSDQ